MKKTYTSIAAMLILASAFAQPSMTGGNVPAVGYTRSISNGTATAPSATGGANITWDYSGASMPTIGTMSVISPTVGPFVASFPTTNFAFKFSLTGGQELFFYYANTAAKLENLASNVTAAAAGSNTYTNGRSSVDFPIAYLGTTTDTYQKTGSSTINTTTNTYDGYGTLKTPYGTYSNIVRIKQTNTAFANPDYMWYQTNPLFMIFSYSSDNNSYISFDGPSTGITAVATTPQLISVVPNPATSEAVFAIANTKTSSGIITIYSSLGQVMQQATIQSGILKVDVGMWAKGTYFYSFKTANSVSPTGKFLVQ